MPKKPATRTTPVTATKHADKRANIPTEELKDFMPEDEQRPAKVLYPRDPSLDPQLVWKGKDEQDSSDLEVPAVPIYIQEKVHPQERREGRQGRGSHPAGGALHEWIRQSRIGTRRVAWTVVVGRMSRRQPT
jgi:adenine-specific DNA-methyltransferase